MQPEIIHILLASVNPPEFSQFITASGYIGIFIWFISLDQVTPIPNEISLLIIGYLSAHGVFDPVIAGGVCLAGFITIDLIYFLLSRAGSRLILKITSRFSEKFMSRYKLRLQNRMPKTIILLCFVPRMRFWNPILVGAMNLSFRKFVLYDFIGLALFTAVYLTLGVVFHRSLNAVIAEMEVWRHLIFALIILLAAVLIVMFARRREQNENRPDADTHDRNQIPA